MSATHKDLKAQVAAGSFREDLFDRPNVVPIRVPPLRERAHAHPFVTAMISFILKRDGGHWLIGYGQATGVNPNAHDPTASSSP
jgi:transcriptional regulator of acetoin/glycerol metabolism